MKPFLEIHASCLKRTMLTKSPAFVFDPADVEALVEETGLNQAQVQQWARTFRFRWGHKSRDEITEHLRSEKQVT
jgi:hypothetical protein